MLKATTDSGTTACLLDPMVRVFSDSIGSRPHTAQTSVRKGPDNVIVVSLLSALGGVPFDTLSCLIRVSGKLSFETGRR